MTDLIAWLSEVLDGDEKRAEAQAKWADGWLDPEPRFGVSHGFVGAPVRPNADQILADIKAKRAILEAHSPDPRDPDVCTTCGEPLEYTVAWPCETARLLASAYADRPGYDEAWV